MTDHVSVPGLSGEVMRPTRLTGSSREVIVRRPMAVLALACVFALSFFFHYPVPPEHLAVAADLPLVDFHEHLLPQLSVEDQTRRMDDGGIGPIRRR